MARNTLIARVNFGVDLLQGPQPITISTLGPHPLECNFDSHSSIQLLGNLNNTAYTKVPFHKDMVP